VTILDEIIAHKHTEIARRQRHRPLGTLMAAIDDGVAEPRDFVATLGKRLAVGEPAVIAELKKASPSTGLLREDFSPRAIAQGYAAAGAACLSVLTDERFFQGHDDYLAAARHAVGLPCLRKDFIVTRYQVYESRLLGADCILLIVAALPAPEFVALVALAHELGLAVLAEVHTRAELDTAMAAGSALVGINNRNLRTFTTSLQVSIDLCKAVPSDRIVVAESGIRTRDHVRLLRAAGIHCFLIGEAFMRAADPGTALRELFAEPSAGD